MPIHVAKWGLDILLLRASVTVSGRGDDMALGGPWIPFGAEPPAEAFTFPSSMVAFHHPRSLPNWRTTYVPFVLQHLKWILPY